MNFIHVSDTHLGASNFKLKEREDDFINAFKKVITYALKEKVEFVIHSGDLFDKGRPTNRILLSAINQLKRLRRAGIPFFTIPGSHDMSVDGTFITVLEKVGLLRNVAKPENFVKEGEYFLMKGEEVNNAVIYGLPGRRDNINAMYEVIKPAPANNKFKIFLFHHIISDVKDANNFADIPINSLPKGMDYYAGGHWHEHENFTYEGKPLIYPGSTEYGDVDAMTKALPRGFIHFKEKPVFIKLDTREINVLNINCNDLSPEEVTKKCINSINESIKGIVIIKLKGSLKSGKRSEIDTVRISEHAVSKGYIHCNVRLSDLINPGENITLSNAQNIEDIEKEFLTKKGYVKEELSIARQLIEILGKDYKPAELNKAVEKAVKLL